MEKSFIQLTVGELVEVIREATGMERDLVDTRGLSEVLGLDRSTIYKYRKEGRIKPESTKPLRYSIRNVLKGLER